MARGNTMHSGRASSSDVTQYFVDDVNIPGFVDEAMIYYADNGQPELDNGTQTDIATAIRRTEPSSPPPPAIAVAMPDFDGAVISVFAVAVILLVIGQTVVVCRQRHRRSCRRRCRKWNVPVFGQLHGLATAGSAIHSPPPPSEVWTALPSSHLSGLFHADNYRTPAFAYINRRSTDSLPAVTSRTDSTGSGASSTAAIYIRAGSSVTWSPSDVGEMTSSSPEKRPTTSLSLSSSEVGGGVTEDTAAAAPDRLDAEAQTDEGQTTTDERLDMETGHVTDDDVIVTSSASINCSPTPSVGWTADDEVDEVSTVDDDVRDSFSVDTALGQVESFDPCEPASPLTLNNSPACTDVQYIDLATDCRITHSDSDNSTC